VNTNGVESFWALLKRGYFGIHRFMSAKHLLRYIKEFAHRHNIVQTNAVECIGVTIDGMMGRRNAELLV